MKAEATPAAVKRATLEAVNHLVMAAKLLEQTLATPSVLGDIDRLVRTARALTKTAEVVELILPIER